MRVNQNTVGIFANTEDYKTDKGKKRCLEQRKFTKRLSSPVRRFKKKIVTTDVEAFIAASRS